MKITTPVSRFAFPGLLALTTALSLSHSAQAQSFAPRRIADLPALRLQRLSLAIPNPMNALPTGSRALDGPLSPGERIGRGLLGLLIPNGVYFPLASSGRSAFGDVKVYNEQQFYTRPRGIGGFTVAGGLEIVQVSDQILPFTGSNGFSLYGLSARFSVPKVQKFRPYVSAGLFYGNVRSNRLNINRGDFTPSMAFGVEYQVNSLIRLTADYRIVEQISGIDMSGFSIGIRIF